MELLNPLRSLKGPGTNLLTAHALRQLILQQKVSHNVLQDVASRSGAGDIMEACRDEKITTLDNQLRDEAAPIVEESILTFYADVAEYIDDSFSEVLLSSFVDHDDTAADFATLIVKESGWLTGRAGISEVVIPPEEVSNASPSDHDGVEDVLIAMYEFYPEYNHDQNVPFHELRSQQSTSIDDFI